MPSNLAQIKAVLLTSGVQQTNNPLWQAINQMLDYLIKFENDTTAEITAASGGSVVTQQIVQPIIQEIGGSNDFMPIPGLIGNRGEIGLLGPRGFDGEDGLDSLIPGPVGLIGPMGLIGPPGMDGIDSDEPSLLGFPNFILPIDGEWTPVLDFGGLSTGITYTSQSGIFRRWGRMMYIECRIVLSNKGSATGVAHITGFPIAVGGLPLGFTDVADAGAGLPGGATGFFFNGGSGTQIFLILDTRVLLTDTNFTNTTDIRVTLTYSI